MATRRTYLVFEFVLDMGQLTANLVDLRVERILPCFQLVHLFLVLTMSSTRLLLRHLSDL